jgi:hypothetical protein
MGFMGSKETKLVIIAENRDDSLEERTSNNSKMKETVILWPCHEATK